MSTKSFNTMIESIQFHKYKDKLCIIQFEIESRKFHRFQEPFVTDKYIELYNWEVMTWRINSIIKKALENNGDWKDKTGSFRIAKDTLKCTYSFVNKSEGYINWSKINYEFDWILKVSIKHSKSSKENRSAHENIENASSAPILLTSDTSSEKTINQETNLKQEIQSPKSTKSEIVIDLDESSQECKRAKIEKNSKSNSKKRHNESKLKSRNDSPLVGRQTYLNTWLSKPKPEDHIPVRKRPKIKMDAPKSDVQKSSNALDHIDKDQLAQMHDFVEKSKSDEVNKEKRKKELENYTMLDCRHVDNSILEEIVQIMKSTILQLFRSEKKSKLHIGNQVINPCVITSSKILTNEQILFLANEIEKLRDEQERGTKEDVMMDEAVPLTIVKIFCYIYDLTEDEAVERLKIQDEKKDLDNSSILNDSH